MSEPRDGHKRRAEELGSNPRVALVTQTLFGEDQRESWSKHVMSEIRVALVAHDARKDELVAWARHHRDGLARCALTATGTTGSRLIEATGLDITRLKSGPWGGDAQLGAMIAEGRLDALIFFTDPMSALPHDVDVKSLIRLSVLYDIPCALSPKAADYILTGILAE